MGKKLKVIIAGSRHCKDYGIVEEAVQQAIEELKIEIGEVVSGGATGVDSVAIDWANNNGINYIVMKAEWDNLDQPNARPKKRYNKWKDKEEEYNANAGFYRNEEMAKYADVLIAVDLNTGGTNHMIKTAKEYKLKVYQWKPKPLTDDEFDYHF